jgi:hypothetical protein
MLRACSQRLEESHIMADTVCPVCGGRLVLEKDGMFICEIDECNALYTYDGQHQKLIRVVRGPDGLMACEAPASCEPDWDEI